MPSGTKQTTERLKETRTLRQRHRVPDEQLVEKLMHTSRMCAAMKESILIQWLLNRAASRITQLESQVESLGGGATVMTERRLEILRKIHALSRQFGYSPTLGEIAGILKITRMAVYIHVNKLVASGLLLKSGAARSIILTDAGHLFLSNPTPMAERPQLPQPKTGNLVTPRSQLPKRTKAS